MSAETLSEDMVGGLADSAVLGEYRPASAAEETEGLKGLIEAFLNLSRGYIRPDYAGKIEILHNDIGIVIVQSIGTPITLLHHVETLGRPAALPAGR